MIAAVVYILCTVTSLLCGFMLWRAHRQNRLPLLRWSALCFAILALSNALLFIDLSVFPKIDLLPLRSAVTLCALVVLLYGLVFESN